MPSGTCTIGLSTSSMAPSPWAPLFGDGGFQFRARILQKGECGIHAGLRAQRIADSQARNDENADQQFLLRHKTRHCFLLQRTCESALVARRLVRRMTTGGSLVTIRF